jgi:RNA polymerase sigma factor (sigma-70 family)
MDSLNNTLRRTLLRLGNAASLTDEDLLARFVAHQDQAAFAELVQRHGPMVLRVCRRVLQHAQDAEDAFQATFIVLARKANTVRLLPNWLYGVAQRVASKARVAAAKRRTRVLASSETGLDLPAEHAPAGEPNWQRTLDEELSRLPDKYRAPLVLCYLEGKSNAEAARLLHCEVGALEMRLTRGRRLLHGRLQQRGLALSVAALTTLLFREASAMALPVSLVMPVVEAVKTIVAGQTTAGVLSPAAGTLAEAVLRETGRRRLMRWAILLATMFLGIGGVALGLWSPAKSPEATTKERTKRPITAPAENVRVFDSKVPLLVLEESRAQNLPAKRLGKTPTADGRGLTISARAHWVVMPLAPEGNDLRVQTYGVLLKAPASPRLTGPNLRAFVNEVRRQQIPGVKINDLEFTDEDLAQLADLDCLETLAVASARISNRGLQQLRLPRLRHLAVESLQVTGAGVAHFSQLERLDVFSAGSGVGDDFSEHLGAMTRLKTLVLARTSIGDAGWQKLGNLRPLQQGLEELWIIGGSIGPEGMAALQRLKRLKRLYLYRCDVNDRVLQEIGKMSQLEALVVDCCGDFQLRWNTAGASARGRPGTVEGLYPGDTIEPVLLPVAGPFTPRGHIMDSGLAHLSRLPRLQELEIAGDEITEAGIQALAPLAGVRHLRLHGYNITDSCLQRLSSWPELQTLDLVGTRTTTAGAAHLRGLARLQVLLLSSNCSDVDRATYEKQLPGVRVLSRPYQGWRDALEMAR